MISEQAEYIDVMCNRIDRHSDGQPVLVATYFRDPGDPDSTGTFVAVKGHIGVEEQLLVGPEGTTPEADLPGWELRNDNQVRMRQKLACSACPDVLPVVEHTTGPKDPGLMSLLEHVIGASEYRVSERRALVSMVRLRYLNDPEHVADWFVFHRR